MQAIVSRRQKFSLRWGPIAGDSAWLRTARRYHYPIRNGYESRLIHGVSIRNVQMLKMNPRALLFGRPCRFYRRLSRAAFT
jgi:hypothetical protein